MGDNIVSMINLALLFLIMGSCGMIAYFTEPTPIIYKVKFSLTDCVEAIKEINSEDAKVVVSQLQLCYKLNERLYGE